ncbi:uncharacterized protein [Littorina saxatilis]|uniref:uncharacterized protein n=1 Tax=Littorina saxatilis TaxID=31220 RepID=UPI0038B5B977
MEGKLYFAYDEELRDGDGSHVSKDGNDDVYPGYGTKELNPKDETKLSSDKEFKLLGQMTWWLTWIEASLRILQEIRQRVEDKELNGNDIVPVVKDKDNGNRFTINSTLKALLTVKSSVNDLHSKLGHENTRTKTSPFRSRKVTVMQACSETEPQDCSKERDRAYILLRDSHKAVEKMLKALSECNVEEKDTKFALVCNRYVIFLKCQKTLCGLQKNRCKCLSWTYE